MSPRHVLAVLVLAACADPLVTLTRVTAEPAGAHCPDGGSAIATGEDADGDGTLDDAEIDDVRYQCVTAPPPVAVLVREDALAPGSACPDGGTSVRVGHDTNGNGELDDAEIEQTTDVCARAEIYEGDLAIELPTTDVAALQGLRVVTGSLLIIDRTTGPGAGTATVSLPALEVVGGRVDVAAAGAVLPALTAVGGDLSLVNAKVAAVPRLATVGGSVDLSYSDLLAFEAPALTSIGDALRASGARHLATIDLPALVTIGHDLTIVGASELTRLSSPQLARVGGSFTVEWMDGLTSVGDHGEFAALAEIDGALTIDSVWSLEGIDLPALGAVGGPIEIRNSDRVRHVGLGALGRTSTAIIQSGALERVELGALVHADALTVDGSVASAPFPRGALVDLDLGALRDAGSLALCGFGAVDALALPSLTTVTDEFLIRTLGGLTAIRLPGLHQVGTLFIQFGANLHELALDPTALVGALSLVELDLTAATSITLPSLVRGTTWFAGNTAPDLGALASLHATGRLVLENNPGLLDLHGLDPAFALDGLEVSANPDLTSLRGLDGLTALRDDLSFGGNPHLTSLDLPSLTSVGAAIDIRDNAALPASELAALLARVGRATTAPSR